jgi:Fic family protein
MPEYIPQPLPPLVELETRSVLKALPEAHRYLAELKGVVATIPNESILINTLSLQEAKDSSAIENIITTHDELFKAELFEELIKSPAAKEVQNYASALKKGFQLVREHQFLSSNFIRQIHEELEHNRAGYRRLPGTELKNQATGEIVFTPPQHHSDIEHLMQNLEQYINDAELSDVDSLIKMAIIHFQFETIHPFYDGNGRTGRIINILYLVKEGLLNIPVLYLSRYVIQNKGEYYRLLQAVREEGAWEEWLLFMIEGVSQTARQSIELVKGIKQLMMDYKHRMRSEFTRMYSQDLLNNLFRHPYTKIEFLVRDLNVSRLTAAKYLDTLAEAGFVEKQKIGRTNYYMNPPLVNLFLNAQELHKGEV